MRNFVPWLVIFWQVLNNPGTSMAKKEILRDGTMQRWFHTSYQIRGIGLLWTDPVRNSNDYTETCGTGQVADFWLITKHLDLSRTFADCIFVEMEVELNLCGGKPCNSTHFQVYIYRGEGQPNFPADAKNANSDLLLNRFTPVYNITNSQISRAINERVNQTFTFYQNGTQGVTFGIRSRGACGKIYRMKLYYYYCEERLIYNAKFAKTVSPANISKVVTANCSANSLPSNNETSLKGYCQSNGTWIINNKTRCLCVKGFEPYSSLGCLPCRENHFKQTSSNQNCISCPSNSVDTSNKTRCECKEGFYRSKKRDNAIFSPCYGLVKVKLDLNIRQIGGDTVNVTWIAPNGVGFLTEAFKYDIKCYLCTDNACNETCNNVKYTPRQNNLTQTFVKVSNLQPGSKYVFRVYPKNSLNQVVGREKWNFTQSEPYDVDSTKHDESKDGTALSYYIFLAGVASALILVIVVLLVIFILRRRSNNKRELVIGNPNQVELPRVGQRMYVDPTNYDSPEDALSEFASELDPSVLFLEMLIGGGEFGDVYKGKMTCPNGKKIPVAVKTLKHDATPKSEKDFMLEASVMGQFTDPNVIRLEGVVTKSTPLMIAIEYMSNGSLDHFLQHNDGSLSKLQLLGMARGVASGMKYLTGINFVHRDLAARNILVNEGLICKISDFGLSRELETADSSRGEYLTTGGKIPVRWTAPEAIKYRKFSSASDVWSYGILLWEIMSFAQRPYWEWDNFKVISEVEDGFRLPAPTNCPKMIHDLMLQCWKKTRSERPSFGDIISAIDEWIRSPETLQDDVDFSEGLSEWLQSIKMGNYVSHFLAAGYLNPSQLSGLKDEDLREMGIKLIGHRNKILKGIRALENEKNGHIQLGRVTSIVV